MLAYNRFLPTSSVRTNDSAEANGRTSRTIKVCANPADLGLNNLTWTLLAVQGVFLTSTALLTMSVGLSINWLTFTRYGAVLGATVVVWLFHYWQPGNKRADWVVSEVLMVLILMVTLGLVAGPAQYAAVALKRPLVDEWLAALDAHMGLSVPRLVLWTASHPRIADLLRPAYFTLLPQMCLPIIIIGFALRDRERLWEYAFHFHVCTVVTVASLALFPAAHAFQYYGFESLIDQERLIRHFNSLRAGTFAVVRFDDIEGLISVPSFHVAGALIATWAFRKCRWVLWPLIVLNVGLVASTFMMGAHYVVDIIVTVPMCVGSLLLYRYLGFSRFFETSAGSDKHPEVLHAKVA